MPKKEKKEKKEKIVKKTSPSVDVMAEYSMDDLQRLWKEGDKNGNGSLSKKEIKSILRRIGIQLRDKDAVSRFKAVAEGKKELDFDQFMSLVENLERRPEIEEIFNKINEGKPISLEQFKKWLIEEQHEQNVTDEMIQEIKTNLKIGAAETISLDVFNRFVGSADMNGPLDNKHETVYQDLTQPYTHYFIASSHNTYLEGDQLKGKSSVNAYRSALERGCRCVELDCWDPPSDAEVDEPIIYHGFTLTSRILFKDVIACIRDYAFKTTPFPLILSIENHCSKKYQRIMAKHMSTILKEFLPDPFFKTKPDVLPSPEDLKFKILIKAKQAKNFKWTEKVEITDAKPKSSKKQKSKTNQIEAELSSDGEASTDDDSLSSDEPLKGPDGKIVKPPKIASALSRLVHLCAVHFESVDKPFGAWQMSSFAEAKLKKLITKNGDKWAKYHTRQLARIYPAGTRVTSSNYDPVPAWNHGAQIVALNYQTFDKPMWFNDALFKDNGASGYVLKPYDLRGLSGEEAAPAATPDQTLKITVISAFKLPQSSMEIPDPFVKIEVRGIDEDCRKARTKVKKDSPYHAVYNQSFTFRIRRPDLAFILFHVYDEDIGGDDFLGKSCARVTLLKSGLRTFALESANGQRGASSLLVDLEWLKNDDNDTQKKSKLKKMKGAVKSNKEKKAKSSKK